jgi:hypothetical protein
MGTLPLALWPGTVAQHRLANEILLHLPLEFLFGHVGLADSLLELIARQPGVLTRRTSKGRPSWGLNAIGQHR